MSDDQPRPVWITEEDVEYLGGQRSAEARAYLKSKWDAAPADAAEATFHALTKFTSSRGAASRAVLRALGMPDA